MVHHDQVKKKSFCLYLDNYVTKNLYRYSTDTAVSEGKFLREKIDDLTQMLYKCYMKFMNWAEWLRYFVIFSEHNNINKEIIQRVSYISYKLNRSARLFYHMTLK